MTEKRVVITGLGPVTPVGVGREQFWQAIVAGKSGTGPLTELPSAFPVDMFRSQIIARIPEELLPCSAEGLAHDRRRTLGDLALRLALEDSGLESLHGRSAALVMGNAVGAPTAVEAIFKNMDEDGELHSENGSPDLLRQMSFHSLAAELAEASGCEGRVLTVSTGCTAGLDAVGTAFEMVRAGLCKIALSGSAEAPITPVVIAAFDLIGALSCRNHDPEHASRPFDRERDGFVLGEGAALLVLEERDHALDRGAHIYAEIRGFASLSNSYHMTNLPSDGVALSHCITGALEDADVAAQEVDFINAHGSSTPQNDLCETNAVKAALGRRAEAVAINSLKSMLGHALGASNAIEIAACALSLDRQFLFPTINLQQPGDGCDLDYVANRGRAAEIQHLVKLSSGFSGIHSAAVISHAEAA